MPTKPDMPEPVATALQALYREAATDEPVLLLDQRILAAARAELDAASMANATATKQRRIPWWKKWLPVTTALAIATIGLSVTWRVMDEQERHFREEMRMAKTPQKPVAMPPQPVAENHAAEAMPTPIQPKTSAPSEPLAIRRSGHGEPQAMPPSERDAQPLPHADAAASFPLAAPAAESKTAGRDKTADALPATPNMPSLTRQTGKRDAGHLRASGEAPGEPAAGLAANAPGSSAPDPTTPEAWLMRIRELLATGQRAEAVQSLTRFCGRYPGFTLPADLAGLK